MSALEQQKDVNYKRLAAKIEAPMPTNSHPIRAKDIVSFVVFSVTGLLIMTIYIVVPFSVVANFFALSTVINFSFGFLIVCGLCMVVFDILKQTGGQDHE